MPDADLDQAAQALIGAAYGSAGERCMAISVAVAVGDCAARLVERLQRQIAAIRVGPATAPAVDMGPLITREHRQRVSDYIATGIKEGASLVVDGRGLVVAGYENGFFLGASLFDHVTPGMRIYREEIFGPVLVVVRVPDFAAALELVNRHEFGNGASIYTADGGTARQFCHAVEAGMVGVNVPIPVPMAFHSFGGWKRSLFGALHVHGMDGVRFYTRLKTITSRWPQSSRGADFAIPTMN
jgi:malonate-semialdehyde dehydrogenase (acetylating)/methylmalonate-semialdehyde dehydrogenase